MPSPTGAQVLSPPTPIGGGAGTGLGGPQQTVNGDNQQLAFSTSDQPPGTGQASLYRVTAQQDGQVFGGYTVVVLG